MQLFTSIPGLKIIADNYCKNYSNENINNDIIKLNDEELLKIPINPKNKNIDKLCDYKINSKIIKLIESKNNNLKYGNIMKYDVIYELILKYLIQNNLIIGNYFIINSHFEEIFHINKTSILHIDQLDNIISYIIKK